MKRAIGIIGSLLSFSMATVFFANIAYDHPHDVTLKGILATIAVVLSAILASLIIVLDHKKAE